MLPQTVPRVPPNSVERLLKFNDIAPIKQVYAVLVSRTEPQIFFKMCLVVWCSISEPFFLRKLIEPAQRGAALNLGPIYLRA